MEKPEIKEAIVSLDTDQIVDFIHGKVIESYEKGSVDTYEEHAAPEIDEEEDTAAGLAFCIKELKDAIEQGQTIEEKLNELVIRSCRFM